jgi:hypothetical protein
MNASQRIDSALANYVPELGRIYTYDQIAEICECSPQIIHVIENKALKRCRRLMRKLQLDKAELEDV